MDTEQPHKLSPTGKLVVAAVIVGVTGSLLQAFAEGRAEAERTTAEILGSLPDTSASGPEIVGALMLATATVMLLVAVVLFFVRR